MWLHIRTHLWSLRITPPYIIIRHLSIGRQIIISSAKITHNRLGSMLHRNTLHYSQCIWYIPTLFFKQHTRCAAQLHARLHRPRRPSRVLSHQLPCALSRQLREWATDQHTVRRQLSVNSPSTIIDYRLTNAMLQIIFSNATFRPSCAISD